MSIFLIASKCVTGLGVNKILKKFLNIISLPVGKEVVIL